MAHWLPSHSGLWLTTPGDHRNKTICQICSIDLTSMSARGKQAHYDDHFEEQPQGLHCIFRAAAAPLTLVLLLPASSSSGGSPGKATKSHGAGYTKPMSKSRFKPPTFFTKGVSIEAQNVFWYSAQATEPPPNFSPGAFICSIHYWTAGYAPKDAPHDPVRAVVADGCTLRICREHCSEWESSVSVRVILKILVVITYGATFSP